MAGHPIRETLAEDAQVGGDGDAPGIAQDITVDDLQAIALSPAPLHERIEQLESVMGALQARSHADRGHEFDGLIEEAQRLHHEMHERGEAGAGRPDLGLDPDTRMDAMAPDEVIDTYGEVPEE